MVAGVCLTSGSVFNSSFLIGSTGRTDGVCDLGWNGGAGRAGGAGRGGGGGLVLSRNAEGAQPSLSKVPSSVCTNHHPVEFSLLITFKYNEILNNYNFMKKNLKLITFTCFPLFKFTPSPISSV